jgi:putative tryptophan/tyrosine transport system substrate-binding protein
MLRILVLCFICLTIPGGVLSGSPGMPSADRLILYLDVDSAAVRASIAKFERALERRGVTPRHRVAVKHVVIDVFDRDEAMARVARAVRERPALVIATSSESASIARDVTADIPIIFGSHQDPVRLALVRSLAEPGGNVAGFTTFTPADLKRLELLREMAPRARRLGVIVDRWWMRETDGEAILRKARQELGFEARVFEMETPEDLGKLRARGARAMDAWYVPISTLSYEHPRELIDALTALRAPVVFSSARFAEMGGLLVYESSQSLDDAMDLFAKLAGLVLDGVPPGTIPVERPKSFALMINATEARRLGIAVPDTLLKRAERVVESVR